jgi:hypothetical protein
VSHYVLTRAVYGPEWPLEANRRRLAIAQAVTVPTMAAQDNRDWSWVVALDPADPLLGERMAAFAAAAPRFLPLMWQRPAQLEPVAWDPDPARARSVTSLVAASAYRAPWRQLVPATEPAFQTRLDDDDGLAPNAIGRIQRAGRRARGRVVLMLPRGLRVYGPRYAVVRHDCNAMQTLFTPEGDDLCVYDYGHTHCARVARVVRVDSHLGWVWTRHRDTLSGWRGTVQDTTPFIRSLFPIDWATVEAAA